MKRTQYIIAIIVVIIAAGLAIAWLIMRMPTITNTAFKYSFKLPKDTELIGTTDTNTTRTDAMVQVGPKGIAHTNDSPTISILTYTIGDNPKERPGDLRTWLNDTLGVPADAQSEDIIIGGQPAIRVQYDSNTLGVLLHNQVDAVIHPNGNTIFTLQEAHQGDNMAIIKAFNVIADSYKFAK